MIGIWAPNVTLSHTPPQCLSSQRSPKLRKFERLSSSFLTTLNGGVARGYVDVPQVERAVAVHLCPEKSSHLEELELKEETPQQGCRASRRKGFSGCHEVFPEDYKVSLRRATRRWKGLLFGGHQHLRPTPLLPHSQSRHRILPRKRLWLQDASLPHAPLAISLRDREDQVSASL